MKHSRTLVFSCSGSDCKRAGGKSLRKQIKESIKGEDLKGQVKLIQTKCMDRCKSSPVVIVGDHFCKKATLEKVLLKLKKP
jgi:NADH:ubiquinone oxidoreductase subunit E